ncbi:hypothetical protein KUTeg_017870 [Tegillarca granosa]|uniref:C2 domain-containing protein n=1 Tax=Tegillarca granosa TaxID=220873 RepID=A0ABQ9EL22_TEGGR|nr:hypothetical protein KUTeg_017870 [Tegillarca granosa]
MSAATTEPDEITVIVVAGKDLQGKKPGRHKFSVIFGIGSKKYRTAVVKDATGCPEWNEESVIQCNNILDQVFFQVTEKDDIIGQVNIPVTSLHGPPGKTIKGQLQPHKKCPNPQGALFYQCYVSSRRPAHKPIIKNGVEAVSQSPNTFKQRHSLANFTPVMTLKGKKEKRHSISTLNKKISRSIHDLLGFGNKHSEKEDDINEDDEPQNNLGPKYSTRFMSIGSGLDSAGHVPIIISVTPKEGLVMGGTRITIEGRNLGFSRSDIIDLLICEVDCLDMLEYESPNRIYCTAKPSTPGKGDIIIETKSGGIGTLRNAFTYCEELPSKRVNPIESEEKQKKLAALENEDIPELYSPKIMVRYSLKVNYCLT